MKPRQRSGWLAAMILGYALLYVVHYAETAYALPRPLNTDRAGMVQQAFLATLRFAPCRWFAMGPCQRFPHLNVALFLAAGALLSLGYLGALRSVCHRPEAWPLARIVRWSALAALPLLVLLPPTSIDYTAYILNGRVASVYHVSPWHHPLQQFPAEHSYASPYVWGPQLECVYGPTFVAAMAMLTFVSHLLAPGDVTLASFLLNVLLLRTFSFAMFLAAAMAIWRINGLLWPRQQRPVTAAFLLNPLLVYEGVAGLHNDLWGAMLLLWACYLFLRNDLRFTMPLLLSILTKYIALFAVPFLGVYYLRRRDWRHIGWLAAALLTSFALIRVTAAENLTRVLEGTWESDIGSGPFWLARLLTLGHAAPGFKAIVAQTSTVLTALFLVVCLALVWRTLTRRQALLHSTWALGIYFVAVHGVLKPWYLIWPVGLLFTLRWTRATVNLVWATSLIPLSYVAYFWHHNTWIGRHCLPIQAIGYVLVAVVPVLTGALGHRYGWSLCGPPEEVAEPNSPPGGADPAWEQVSRLVGPRAE